MKLLRAFLFFSLSTVLWGMTEDKIPEKTIPILTYDNKKISFPLSIILRIPFLDAAVKFKGEHNLDLLIDLKDVEYCTSTTLDRLERLFTNENFKKFLLNISKEKEYEELIIKNHPLNTFMTLVTADNKEFREYLFESSKVQGIFIDAIKKKLDTAPNSLKIIGLTKDEFELIDSYPKNALLKINPRSAFFIDCLRMTSPRAEFNSFLLEFKKNNISLCHKALHETLSHNKNKHPLHLLWPLIILNDYFALDRSIKNVIIAYLNTIDLSTGNNDSLIAEIIEQDIIKCPTSLFNNELRLFKQIISKENEKLSTHVWFDSEMKQCIFIQQSIVDNVKQGIQNLQHANKSSNTHKEKNLIKELKVINFASDTPIVRSSILKTIPVNDTFNIHNYSTFGQYALFDDFLFDVNKDKKHIACIEQGTISIYNMNTLKEHVTITMPDNQKYTFYSKLQFSPNGQWLAVQLPTAIEIYSTNDYTIHQVINIASKDFNFSSNGDRIVCGNSYGDLYIYALNEKMLYQQQFSAQIKSNMLECCFINHDKAIHCTTGGKHNIMVDYNKQTITSIPYSYICAAYDTTQDTIALARYRRGEIKFCSVNNLTVPNNEEKFISSGIYHQTERGLTLSSDGNYLLNVVKERDGRDSIDIYHVPVFSYTAETLNQNEKWFVFFCDYCQRNNIPVPFADNFLYDELSGSLKIKFKNVLIENWKKIKKEHHILQQEKKLKREKAKERKREIRRVYRRLSH